MELIKIKPLNIIKRTPDAVGNQRHPFYARASKINISLSENKKFHVLISEGA